MRIVFFSALLMVVSIFSYGQSTQADAQDSVPFYEMSLEQLMNVNVTVASELSMTNREAPGIVTIITQEEIINSGARDLMQVLEMVPALISEWMSKE